MSEPIEDLDAQTRRDAAPDQAALGTPIAVFQTGFRKQGVFAAFAAILFGCHYIYSPTTLVADLPEVRQTAYRALPVYYRLPLGFLAFLRSFLPILGVFFLVRAFLYRRRRIVICPGGVVLRILGPVGVVLRILGREQVWCHWNEIREIQVYTLQGSTLLHPRLLTVGGVVVAGRRYCSLVKRDGSRVVDMVDSGFGPFGVLVDSLRPMGNPGRSLGQIKDLNVRQFGAMVDTLRQVSEPYHIPWKEEVVKPVFGDAGSWGSWIIWLMTYGIIVFDGIFALGILALIVRAVVLIFAW